MKTIAKVFSFGALVGALGCGGGAGPVKVPVKPVGPRTASGDAVTKVAENAFNSAVDAFTLHEVASDWNDASCADVAKKFDAAAASQNGKFPEATFDAGLVWQRCSNDKEALPHFKQALSQDPNFHYARAQVALYQYKADGNVDAGIGEMQRSVLDSKFQNIPALVDLAMLQMLRDGAASGDGCKDDMECAKKNLQRALAVDDSYMPAFNQLALYYFKQAKKRAGYVKSAGLKRGREIVTHAADRKRADTQQLELAALVCSQAIHKNAKYAPIHNTAGLIQNELGQINGAVGEFKTAASLDPKFFEAQMNFAFVNLSFRGFENAQSALEKAVAMQPGDYDAHLGLALALRGQISDVNFNKLVPAVQAELAKAKQIDANRPDAYYNEGILVQEFEAKAGGDKMKVIASYDKAKGIFQQFMDKAQGKPEYDGAVKRTKERVQDMQDIKEFLLIPDAPTTPPSPPAAVPPTEGAPPAAGQAGAAPKPAPGGAPTPPVQPPKK